MKTVEEIVTLIESQLESAENLNQHLRRTGRYNEVDNVQSEIKTLRKLLTEITK